MISERQLFSGESAVGAQPEGDLLALWRDREGQEG